MAEFEDFEEMEIRMGKYTESVKTSIRRRMGQGLTLEEAYHRKKTDHFNAEQVWQKEIDEIKANAKRLERPLNAKEEKAIEWSGYRGGAGNPLMRIFRNDSIYAPIIVPSALEWAWNRWRDGEASDDEVRDGLHDLFAWISQTARDTPTSALFEGAF